MSFCNEQLLQRVMSDFLQLTISATSNKRILQRVAGDFLQRVISIANNERILQWVISKFLQRATSATSNKWLLLWATYNFWSEQLLQRVRSKFSNEKGVILQQVKKQWVNFKE